MNNEVFPVINSILSPGHLAEWVTEQYGFKNVKCQVLRTHINHTYQVTTDSEDYILRIYGRDHRSERDVEAEVKLLCGLNDIISVSVPIVTAGGDYIQEIKAPEGIRYVVLFSFAPGKKMRNLTAELNFNIGVEVGKFHHFTQDRVIDRIDYSTDALAHWAYGQLAGHFSEEIEEMQTIKALGANVVNAFDKQDLARGIVHLDIWYDNMNITDDGLISLFDFDNCGNGWLILDVGYYCMQLFFIEADKEEYERKKAAFINGYRSKNILPDNEYELVPYAGLAIMIHYLGVQAKNFDITANFYLSQNYLKMMVARIKDWMAYNNR